MVLALIPLLCGAVLVPLAAGLNLWRRAASHPLAGMAAFLTLKPFLTTPFWMLLAGGDQREAFATWNTLYSGACSVAPAALLTAATVYWYWPVFTDPYRAKAWTLIGLDCLRWGNSMVFVYVGHLPRSGSSQEGLSMLLVLVALLMPMLVAGAALAVCSDDSAGAVQ